MYSTGNPVSSSALEDMADNAQVFDGLVTKTSGTVTDRLGNVRRPFQQIVTDMGFNPVTGSFQSGATVTEYNQCLLDTSTGTFYSWNGALPKVVPAGSTPATSGGIGALLWVDRTDLMLRSDLGIVTKIYNTVSAMLADTTLILGKNVSWLGYRNLFDAGGGHGVVVAAGTGTADGGSYFSLSNGLQIKAYFDDGTARLQQFGAYCDGTSDDTSAIDNANNWLALSTLTSPRKLVIQLGGARYTAKTKLGAITLTDVSGFTIEFKNGGYLKLDNLTSGSGTTGGLFVSGTASKITIINPDIRWATLPSVRSTGDGMMFKGYPDDSLCLQDIKILGKSNIMYAPQTGAIFLGCKNVTVENHFADTTLSDGLHFNACKNVTVGNVTTYANGDDSLAFVTYYNASDVGGGGASWKTSRTPYSQPSLGDWNNREATANSVKAIGGSADALRVSGSLDVTVGSVTSKSKLVSAVQIDAGIADGVTYNWTYLASKNIKIGSINSDSDANALFVRTFNSSASDTSYGAFDVHIGLVNGRSNTQYCTQINAVSGVVIDSIKEASAVSYGTYIYGASKNINIGTLVSNRTSGLALNIAGSCSDITIGTVDAEGGSVHVSSGSAAAKMNRINFGTVIVKNTPTFGAFFSDVNDLNIDHLKVYNANSGNSASASDMRFLMFNRCSRVGITKYTADALVENFRLYEIGGGTATDAPNLAGYDINVVNIRARLLFGAATGITIQGGPFGPVDYSFTGKWQNTSVDALAGAWTAIATDTYA